MTPTRELLSIEEAQELVLARVEPLPTETVPVEDAVGRVLAEPAPAAIDLPPFDSSAMDGFALRSEDTPGTLPVPFRIAAGSPAERSARARRGDGHRDGRRRSGGSRCRHPARVCCR